MGLTCTLLQVSAAAHVDVVYSDMSSCRVFKKPLKHHLHQRKGHTGELSLCVSFLIQGFINTLTLSGYLPDILWGFEEGWCAPLSSDCLGHLLMPITGSLPGRCPSAGPSGCPVPLPGAGSRTGGRAGLALAPLRGSAAGLSCAGCGFRHRDEGSSLKNLKEAKKLCWLWYRCKLGNSFHTNGL